MFKQQIKYTLLGLTVLSLSACNKRTIILHPGVNTHTTQQERGRTYRVERPIIQEEILIRKEPEIVKVPEVKKEPIIKKEPESHANRRVAIPQNNPSLGTTEAVSVEDPTAQLEEPATSVNVGKMERIEFPVDEYRQIKKIGRSTVKGSIYVENSHNSQKIMGQNVKLYLNPVTSYSKQWYEESYLGGYKMGKSDPRLFNYLKFTMSDGNGKFNFFGIAPGSYYLVGTVDCAEECGYSKSTTIRLVEEITVGRGTSSVDLMKNVP